MSPDSMSGDVLREVLAARAGDREALGRVLGLMRPYLIAVGNKRIPAKRKAETEDLVQAAIVSAVRAFGGFEGTTVEELRGWLRQILLNKIRDDGKHDQADRRHPRHEVNGDEAKELKVQLAARTGGPMAEMIRQEKISVIRFALDQLKEEHREVIALRCTEELAFEEIGTRMNRTRDAARKLWERALDDLKWRLQEMREEDSDFQEKPRRRVQ